MLVVAALGGNALLKRGERPDARVQQGNMRRAAGSIAELVREHSVVLTHGNGPQVGVLSLESELDQVLASPYPLDAIGAETQGVIGYWLAQELANVLPDRPIATVVTRTVVDGQDPAFADPAKFVGQAYDESTARSLAARWGWTVKPDGGYWRRVVPSPRPREFLELPALRTLLAAGTLVICAGGGGIPVIRADAGFQGVEAVVDKDLSAALLARQLGADALLILTDVAGVEVGYGTDAARLIAGAAPEDLRKMHFPAGSMGPKVDAACLFVERGGRLSAIGPLEQAGELLRGNAGTVIRGGERFRLA